MVRFKTDMKKFKKSLIERSKSVLNTKIDF